MPPKKKVADEGAEAGGDGAFRWTPENERALFVLIIERTLTTDDYHKIVEALPPGANYNGVRQRISKFRKEQRARFEELGWPLPDGAATKTPIKSPKKRAAATDNNEEGGDAETGTLTKKPRARKPKKETVKKEADDEGLDGGGEVEDAGVKEEMVEDVI